MRLLEFRPEADRPPSVGVVDRTGAGVIDVTARLGPAAESLSALLQHRDRPVDRLLPIADLAPDYGLDEIEFLPLLAETGRVFAAGLNYNKKYPAGKAPPQPRFPVWFSKLPGTLVGHGQPIVAPSASITFDYEAELAAVLGRGARHVTADDALDLVAGWTCLNDGSVREWQRHSVSAGKNFQSSGSIGPWMVTADEIDDPHDLRLMARVDGEPRQSANTGEMIFSVGQIISYLSKAIELRPGDVVATGSPEGTGASFDPPRFLTAGQTVEIEVAGIGVLANPVIDEFST